MLLSNTQARAIAFTLATALPALTSHVIARARLRHLRDPLNLRSRCFTKWHLVSRRKT
jgi:hypothetical protein